MQVDVESFKIVVVQDHIFTNVQQLLKLYVCAIAHH